MNDLLRKFLWSLLGAALVGSLILECRPHAQPTSRLTTLPVRGLGFTSRDLPLNEAEATVFRRAGVMKRLYQVGDSQFVLLGVDSATDRHALHDPLYCFRGAGWTIQGEIATPLPQGHGKLVRLWKGQQTAEALYWITDGNQRHASPLQAWWQSTTRRLSLAPTEPAPALVLLQPLAGQTVKIGRAHV